MNMTSINLWVCLELELGICKNLEYMVVFWLYFGCIMVVFWLYYGCILVVFWLHYHCILIAFSLYFGCILVLFWLYFDCNSVVFWLHFCCFMVVFWLHLCCMIFYFNNLILELDVKLFSLVTAIQNLINAISNISKFWINLRLLRELKTFLEL